MKERPVLPFVLGLLLVVLFWQVGGFMLIQLNRVQVRKEVKHRIKNGVPEEERVVFHFTAAELADLQWMKEGKEFRIDGRFYDVVERTLGPNGTVRLACISDDQETRLFAQLDALVDQAMNTRERRSGGSLSPIWFFPGAMDGGSLLEVPGTILRFRTEVRAPAPGHVQCTDPPPKA